MAQADRRGVPANGAKSRATMDQHRSDNELRNRMESLQDMFTLPNPTTLGNSISSPWYDSHRVVVALIITHQINEELNFPSHQPPSLPPIILSLPMRIYLQPIKNSRFVSSGACMVASRELKGRKTVLIVRGDDKSIACYLPTTMDQQRGGLVTGH